jgi:hypothetical protein
MTVKVRIHGRQVGAIPDAQPSRLSDRVRFGMGAYMESRAFALKREKRRAAARAARKARKKNR